MDVCKSLHFFDAALIEKNILTVFFLTFKSRCFKTHLWDRGRFRIIYLCKKLFTRDWRRGEEGELLREMCIDGESERWNEKESDDSTKNRVTKADSLNTKPLYRLTTGFSKKMSTDDAYNVISANIMMQL